MYFRGGLEDQFFLVESLREEIGREIEKRTDLERQFSSISSERESLADSLEVQLNRVVALEQRFREKEQQLRMKDSQLEEAREAQIELLEQIQRLNGSARLYTSEGVPDLLCSQRLRGLSLQSELDMLRGLSLGFVQIESS